MSARPETEFTFDLYRMGYYQGTGARHVLRREGLVARSQEVPVVQPIQPCECTWEPTLELEVGSDWLSGVYLGKLTAAACGTQSYTILVVRDDRPADFIVQCSDFTWQTYNRWPEKSSLYDHPTREGRDYWGPGAVVGFDRPYTGTPFGAIFAPGTGDFFPLEFPFHYWLEREGYDVTYCSNLDTHLGSVDLERAAGFLSIGHDEYYTIEMYARLLDAVASGTSLAFFSGNTCCGRIGLRENSEGRPNRTLERLDRFGDSSERELSVLPGMADLPHTTPSEALLIGARTIAPVMGCGDWICIDPEHWIFEGTGMRAGDSIQDLVGFESHGDPADIPGLEVIARGETWDPEVGTGEYTATVYPGPEGNIVFNAATVWWSSGLAIPPGFPHPSWRGRAIGGRFCATPDARVQTITSNVLRRMRDR